MCIICDKYNFKVSASNKRIRYMPIPIDAWKYWKWICEHQQKQDAALLKAGPRPRMEMWADKDGVVHVADGAGRLVSIKDGSNKTQALAARTFICLRMEYTGEMPNATDMRTRPGQRAERIHNLQPEQ